MNLPRENGSHRCINDASQAKNKNMKIIRMQEKKDHSYAVCKR